jgi:putative hemolysin
MKLIDLRASAPEGVLGEFLRRAAPAIETMLSIHRINDYYRQAVEHGRAQTDQLSETDSPSSPIDSYTFYRSCIEVLNLDLQLKEGDLDKVPAKGPLVVVANHPFGGLEGVILAYLIKKVRPDVRVMGNYLLNEIEEMRPDLITVDPFGSGVKRNIAPIREAIQWVSSGGALIVFPSGEVSSLSLKTREVEDPDWSTHVAAILRRTRASVVNVFFSGRNSGLFQALGLIHPRLRTALLPREMANKAGQKIAVSIGRPIVWRHLEKQGSNDEIMRYLRLCTYFLSHRPELERKPRREWRWRRPAPQRLADVVEAVPQSLLIEELASLPEEALLVEQGDFAVYHATFQQIPHIMNEIGRLREVTFRGAQEGTGLAIDLDQYDHYYLHLFLWSKSKQEIVGAYRLGQMDKILTEWGAKGVYSGTLFHYQPQFIAQLEGALEMGRSFIRQEYQRRPQSLPLLWRGIGEYLVRNPHYSVMFGPVSIGQDYQEISKALMIEFLKKSHLEPELSGFVKPKTPVEFKWSRRDQRFFADCAKEIDDVSMMISDIEEDGRGIPILLRHYMKLGGKLISFNLDRQFSDAIDGLIWVDIKRTDPKLVRRFQGEKGSEFYLAYHQASDR